jgi:hypothetical protein
LGRYEGVFSLPIGPGGKSKGGVKKIKLGRNEGRGAGLVAGTGEPEAAQERESRGGAARRGVVEGKKNKGKHIFVQAFFNPAYRR